MSILRRRVRQVVPVWVLAVVCIGLAAGAYIWISNIASNNVQVTDNPIELVGQFETPVFVDVISTSTINYTINDPGRCTGYIYLEFHVSGLVLDGDEIYQLVRVYPDGVSAIITTTLRTDVYSNAIIYILADDSGGPIDFGFFGGATKGQIEALIVYHVSWLWTVTMTITETAS
ncbi:MAG: hypothetical protein ACFFEF_16395 [Candidatus Thorarchaeota archaeon]